MLQHHQHPHIHVPAKFQLVSALADTISNTILRILVITSITLTKIINIITIHTKIIMFKIKSRLVTIIIPTKIITIIKIDSMLVTSTLLCNISLLSSW